MQMNDGKTMAARNGKILNVLLNIEFWQFLDGKRNSKLSNTMNIDQGHSF